MNAYGQTLSTRAERQELSLDLRGDNPVTPPAAFQQLSAEFATVVDEREKSPDQANLERLRALRARIVEVLLAVKQVGPALAPSVNTIGAACLKSGLRSHSRTPHEEELFQRCLTAVDSASTGESPSRWLAAVMMASHAFELPTLPPLAAIPQDIHGPWLSFLLETPSSFARNGDGDKFARYLQLVCEQLLQHLRSTLGPQEEIVSAFLSSRIFVQSYFNELNLRELMMTRAAIIEDILTRRGATLDQLRVMRPCKSRPRIGIIVLTATAGAELIGLLAHLERLDRRRFETRLYSFLEPSGKIGALCRTAAESHLKLPESIPEAVARLRGQDLDIAFFCTNLTAVVNPLTQIAAHRVAPIQATTLASVTTTGLRNMDVMFSSAPNETENSSAHYSERLALADGVIGCFPFHYILEGQTPPDPVFRSAHGIPDEAPLFFSGANFYKILPELSELWFHILSQVPNSHLMLMPFNPNWSTSYPLVAFNTRLRTQAAAASIALDRLHLHTPTPTIAQLHRIMEMADIYLDGFPFCGAASLADALVVGLPIVAREGVVFRSRMSKAILEEASLRDWVCPDETSYAQRAIELGRNSDLRDKERKRLQQIRGTGLRLVDTAPFALMMMRLYDGVVADWNARVEALHADPGALVQRISELGLETAERGAVFTDRDLILQVVLPYLRSGGTRRLIEVGAGWGAMSKPFLEEGWQVVMFEPDERCEQALAALVEAHSGQARFEKAAVTADRDGSVRFHLARIPGLSGLSKSPVVGDVQISKVRSVALARYIAAKGLFDMDFINIDAQGDGFAILKAIDFKAVTPRLVMASFGDQFADQDRASIDRTLQDMRTQGYRACVVCLGVLPPFQRQDWPKRMLAIGIDVVPQLPAGDPLFGNILFFREADRDFLPSLCDWLEQPFDWEQRRSFRA
jgi:FkbM family methyltransferase